MNLYSIKTTEGHGQYIQAENFSDVEKRFKDLSKNWLINKELSRIELIQEGI